METITPKVADPSTGVVKALREEAEWARAALVATAKPQDTDAINGLAMAYRPKFDAHTYSCPHCWMHHRGLAPLFPRNGTNDYDMLGCRTCGNDVIIPF